MKAKARACELCTQEAFLHCPSDEAFLCYDCDARVHRANFLVARHLRQTLCSQCKCLTGMFIYGERSPSLSSQPICPSCSTIAAASSPTASSDCISSTESSAVNKMGLSNHLRKEHKWVNAFSSSASDISGEISGKPPRREKMVDSKVKGIFVIWCRRLGLSGNYDSVVSLACQALELCLQRPTTVLPFRVSLAASFWAGLRMCGDESIATWQNLRMFEAASGVPAKFAMAVETRLARVITMGRRSRQDLEEGWAECNV